MTSRSFSLALDRVIGPSETAASEVKQLSQLSDTELMMLVKKRDEGAFSELFDRHYEVVRGIARRVLRNEAEVPDAVQESFINVFQYAESFEPNICDARRWITRVAFRRCLKRALKLKRGLVDFVGQSDDEVFSLEHFDSLPERLTRDLDFRRSVRTGLDDLPEPYRQTIYMFFYEDRDLREIAERLGKTYGNTRNYFYRGLSKLAEVLIQSGLLDSYRDIRSGYNEKKGPN